MEVSKLWQNNSRTSEGLLVTIWLSKRIAIWTALPKSFVLFSKRSAFTLFTYVSHMSVEQSEGP